MSALAITAAEFSASAFAATTVFLIKVLSVLAINAGFLPISAITPAPSFSPFTEPLTKQSFTEVPSGLLRFPIIPPAVSAETVPLNTTPSSCAFSALPTTPPATVPDLTVTSLI